MRFDETAAGKALWAGDEFEGRAQKAPSIWSWKLLEGGKEAGSPAFWFAAAAIVVLLFHRDKQSTDNDTDLILIPKA